MEKIDRTVASLKEHDFKIVDEIKVLSDGIMKIVVSSHGEVQKILHFDVIDAVG